MIKLVTGLPGAGKGYYSVLVTEAELANTDRPVVSNFAFELQPWIRPLKGKRSQAEAGFMHYLETRHRKSFDVAARLFKLSDEDFKEFYLWRCRRVEGRLELFKVDAKRDAQGRVVEFDREQISGSEPCMYLMDEAWKFINARLWADAAKGVQFYASLHRHLGDDLWITAQYEDQVDKAVRSMVQEYHSLVNHRYRKVGMFKQPNCISVVISNESPKQRGKSLAALPKLIRFDTKGVGGSFDTAGGLGRRGYSGGDIETRTKGLPWWGLFAAIIGLGAGVILLAKGMGWFSGKLLTGTLTTPPAKAVSAGSKEMVKPWNPLAVTAENSTPKPMARLPAPTESAPALEMTGFALVSGRAFVSLSDGTTYESGDGHLQLFSPRYCVVDGRKIWMTHKSPKPEPPRNGDNAGRASFNFPATFR